METCSSRVLLLRVPTCAVLTSVRRLRKGCPSLSLLRPSPLDSCLRRNDEWLARERRGFGSSPTAWEFRLACYGFVGASITSPHPSPTATTVFVTGLWQRFARLHSSERKTSFSGLWRDIAGGSYVGDPCYPARCRTSFNCACYVLKGLRATPLDAAILRVRGVRLTPLDLNIQHMLCGSQIVLNCDFCDFSDGL